jgi:sulfoacetaldehyde dehydrogenase
VRYQAYADELLRRARVALREIESYDYSGFENALKMVEQIFEVGGNITSENIHLKHYMNTTWVSRPIPEDRPSE